MGAGGLGITMHPERDPSRGAFRWGSLGRTFGLSLLASLFVWLSLAPVSLWVLTFLPPALLTAAAVSARGPVWRHGLAAWAGSAPLWAEQMHWTSSVTAMGYPPLVLYLSSYAGLFVVLTGWLGRRWPRLAPAIGVVVWVGLEAVRGEIVFHGYAWYLIAHPLIGTGLDLPARFIGQYGVGLLVASASIGLLWALVVPGRWRAGAALGVVGLVWGVLSLAPAGVGPGASERTLVVGIVQTDVAQDVRGSWSFESQSETLRGLDAMTRRAAAEGAQLVVWPETMYPGYILDKESFEAVLRSELAPEVKARALDTALWAVGLQSDIGAPLLVGASSHRDPRVDLDDDDLFVTSGRYNSAIVIERGGVSGERYDKVRLAPFGEEIPYASAWPWLERKMLDFGASGMRFDLSKGERMAPLSVGFDDAQIRVAAPICFESAVSWHCRRLVRGGGSARADLLVTQTNDGWFGSDDTARLDHLLCARWRALELGIPVARSANTGVSALIDARGRVLASLGAREAGLLVGTLELGAPLTAYAVVGDVAGVGCTVVMIGLVIVGCVQRRKAPRADAPADGRTDLPGVS